jgi:hypothetical protein
MNFDFSITAPWSVRLDGEFAFVREKLGDMVTEYGPMPRDFAGPFIDESRERIEASIERAKR